MKSESLNFFSSLYESDLKSMLSLEPADVNRLDDHRIGIFLSIFGPLGAAASLAFYRSSSTGNFRKLLLGFVLSLAISSFFYTQISLRVGGFFRTTKPFILILLGASVLTMIMGFRNHYLKYASISIAILALVLSLPHARQHVTNVHRESFAGGEVYSQEVDFVRRLPVDGRIITYINIIIF